MKFKVKHEKSNLILMSSILFLCLFTCIFWLVLREYIYFIIYFVLTFLIAYIYFFTFYYLDEKFLKTKLGFFKVKIKYRNITKVENLNSGIKIHLNKMNFTIYPSNKDIFWAKLNSELTNKNSYNIIDKK